MSQFSRRARWLQQIFTPSVVPTVTDPTIVSDDVSLVQQYDGGALGIAEPSFPAERDGDADPDPLVILGPEVAIRDYVSKTGINTVSDMYQMPSGLYARIFAMTTILVAGSSPAQWFVSMQAPTGSGVSNHSILVTPNYNAISGSRIPRAMTTTILPPGMQLNMHVVTGNASTQVRLSILWIVAPIGAIIINSSGYGASSGV